MTTTDFTGWFRSLVAALGAEPGWYAAFAARRPGTVRAYEAGTELPPWDVVDTVLHEAAAAHGRAPAPAEIARVRALHRAAVAAWDAAPGAEPALRARLDAAVREEEDAADREREAATRARAVSSTSAAAARLAAVHAWARDDHRRAAVRRVELQTRLLSLRAVPGAAPSAVPGAGTWPPPVVPPGRGLSDHRMGPAGGIGNDGSRAGATAGPRRANPDREPLAVTAERRRRPRGARFFAGAGDEAAGPPPSTTAAPKGPAPRGARFAGAPQTPGTSATDPTSAPDAAHAAHTAPTTPAAPAPRGARFAGTAAEAPHTAEPPEDPRWSADAGAVVAHLARSRAAGESGGVYVALCRAAVGPGERLPYLVRELERAGYAADVATLLWEVAVLPAGALASAARALAVHGRSAQCRTLLQQAVSRPAEDIAAVAAALPGPGRDDLLAILVRTRPPEAVADVARLRSELTVPLLTAAAGVSTSRRHDLTAAFHRAGLPLA